MRTDPFIYQFDALNRLTNVLANGSVAAGYAFDAVGNLQLGTAVFRFDRDHWETEGRAILNLSPSEAIRFYRNDLEKVGEELAHHS